MKSSILALSLFFLLFAFAAEPSLAARHDSGTNYYIVAALRGVVEDGLNLVMPSNHCPSKKAWPELVGENGEVAAAIIEKENPCVHAIVLLEGTPVTKDYRLDRVRVWVNKQGKVIKVPRIG